MIVAFTRSREARPSAWSAANVSSTRTCGPPTGCDTIAPAAPDAKAASTNLCPSWTEPGMATNRSPTSTSRLSKVTPLTSNGALTLPPVAAAISSLVQRGVIIAPPYERSSWGGGPLNEDSMVEGFGGDPSTTRLRRAVPLPIAAQWRGANRSLPASRRALPRDQRVVERQHLVTDDLAGFVALAGDQHDVAVAGDADRFGDGFAAASDLGRAGCSGHDRRANSRGVLAARIVVGDNHHVGHLDRHSSHFRSFALVAVAARAEDGNKPALHVGAQRSDRRFERVGGMRVIDIDRNAGAADDSALEPPAHRRHPLHRGEYAVEPDPGRQREAGGNQHVRRLVRADERKRELEAAILIFEQQRLPQRSWSLVDKADHVAVSPHRHHPVAAPFRTLDHFLRLRIVGPDHGRPARLQKLVEQPHLRFEIGLHCLVIVEMVAAEVGERRRRQRNTLAAVLVEAVARCFVGDVAHAH